MKKLNTKMLVTCGILTAMTVVLAEFMGINLSMVQISFNFVPIVFSAMYLGPIPCCIISALADFLGALMFQGSVNPFITIISALMGLSYGAFLYSASPVNRALKTALCAIFKGAKKAEQIADTVIAAIAVIFDLAVFTFALTPVTLHLYYGLSYAVIYAPRVLKALIMLPLETVVISLLDVQIIPRVKRSSALRRI